jgi:hypothetical protein
MAFHPDFREWGSPAANAIIAGFAPIVYGVKKFREITESSRMVISRIAISSQTPDLRYPKHIIQFALTNK